MLRYHEILDYVFRDYQVLDFEQCLYSSVNSTESLIKSYGYCHDSGSRGVLSLTHQNCDCGFEHPHIGTPLSVTLGPPKSLLTTLHHFTAYDISRVRARGSRQNGPL